MAQATQDVEVRPEPEVTQQDPSGAIAEQKEAAIAARIQLENQHKGGANWFFWIVGLSVVNSLIVMFQGEWSFAIGLGITQVIDAIGLAVADGAANPRAIMAGAFVLDLLAASVFVLFGVFARRRMAWAFVVGMVLYAIDGLIFLLAADVLSLGFHALGLWGLWGGLRACRALKAGVSSPRRPVRNPA